MRSAVPACWLISVLHSPSAQPYALRGFSPCHCVFLNMTDPIDDISIPFHNEIYEGLGEIHGRLRLGHGNLVIEYMAKDAVFGLLRGRVRELRIPLIDIEDIELHNGWFRKRITIRSNSITSFADFPGAESGVLVLRIKRRDIARAQVGVSRLRLLQSEQKLKALDEWGES